MATTQRAGKKRQSGVNGAEPKGNENTVELEAKDLLRLYREMVQIRIFEEACQRGFRRGKIGGYLHVYIGQEAVALGFLDAFNEGDKAITAYRDHAHALLLGSEPKAVMAELYGKATGLVSGKGGSMHLFNAEHGMMGGYGIVGGHIPLGVGMAYALAYQETSNLVQLYLGDGSMHNGAFHEAANISGLWGRDGLNPCLFIIENNQYGMGTSVERSTAMTDLAAKFDAYGIENEKVDGMDLEAVIACARRVTKQVRESGKPYAVEALTYRTVPHGAGDFFQKYRTKEEIDEWRKRDPVGLLEAKILERGAASEEELAKVQEEAKQIVDEAVTFAEESPVPDESELLEDVYGEAYSEHN
jgi:pyruvate dehydrogenase E1 component alpha subunit